jgi:sugar phosphate isomerase/epimerase
MKKSRRSAVRLLGATALGATIMPQWACKTAEVATNKTSALMVNKPSLDAFGLQLYTLRDVIVNNPKETIRQVSTMGYKQIEGYDGPQGMFWNMGHIGFKSYITDLGLDMVSSHVNINEDFEQKCAQAAEIGMKYLICPYIGPQKSMDAWKVVTDKFNVCGAMCKKHGIRFAYHNHAYSFIPFSGMIPHDYIMTNTDADTVDHEMDIYWVVTGGADPKEYLKKYPGRFRLCHVKDRMKNAGDERQATCDLGTGIIDFASILKVARENGMQYYIVEQERYDGSTPLKSAQVDADYLKRLVFV